jgi:hypothetical protein
LAPMVRLSTRRKTTKADAGGARRAPGGPCRGRGGGIQARNLLMLSVAWLSRLNTLPRASAPLPPPNPMGGAEVQSHRTIRYLVFVSTQGANIAAALGSHAPKARASRDVGNPLRLAARLHSRHVINFVQTRVDLRAHPSQSRVSGQGVGPCTILNAFGSTRQNVFGCLDKRAIPSTARLISLWLYPGSYLPVSMRLRARPRYR